MRARAIFFLTLASALGSGMVAGVFFGFSAFIMKALGRLPPSQGISAMQSIEIVVVQSLLMPLMFGTALICLALGDLDVLEFRSHRHALPGGAGVYPGAVAEAELRVSASVARHDVCSFSCRYVGLKDLQETRSTGDGRMHGRATHPYV